MITFEKSKRYLFIYGGLLVVIIGLFISWVIMLSRTEGSTSGDIVLLSLLFLFLFGGQIVFFVLYLVRPKVVLSIDEENAYIHLTRKKTKVVSFINFSSVGNMRRNLVIATRDADLYVIRFLKAQKEAEETLKAMFNAFIKNHPDRYFKIDEANEKEEDTKE